MTIWDSKWSFDSYEVFYYGLVLASGITISLVVLIGVHAFFFAYTISSFFHFLQHIFVFV